VSEWAPKRFWTQTSVKAGPDGYGVTLDGKPVRTPGKNPLTMPTRAMAEKVAEEWDAVEKTIDPMKMPVTRAANSAIEKVATQRAGVIEMLAAYGDTDLLCYRADHPQGLVERQADLWDPALDWAAETLGARLEPRTGLMHAPQPAKALSLLEAELQKFDEFQLTAVHDLITLTSSLVLGLAATRGWQTPEYIWSLSRIDEDWQAEQWGLDDEAEIAAEARKEAFLKAVLFFELCSAE